VVILNAFGGASFALGNVSQRDVYWDTAAHFTEAFDYDNLNRLRASTIGAAASVFDYDAIGNIVKKTGTGTGEYAYPASGAASVRPHAVKSIPGVGIFDYDDNGNLLAGEGRSATWTSFDMPKTITKGEEWSTFVYGPDYQRVRQDKADRSSTYYAGAFEVVVGSDTTTVKTYWPNGLGVEIEVAGGNRFSWTHLDRQGSVIGITDEQGKVLDKIVYDSWGKRRNLGDAGTPDDIVGVVDNKGYTGHEMLDGLDLVHMNGRVYDPLVARFMSADPLIQEPEHSQSYNRYAYVWNNPTNLTDPTGFQAQTQASQSGANCDVQCREDRSREEQCRALGGNCRTLGISRTEQARNNSIDPSAQASNNNNSANSEPSYSRVGFSSVSGFANDGSSVQVIHDTWKRDSKYYGTPDQIMGQWLAFNPIEEIARSLGASQRQAFWLGFGAMVVGNPRQLLAGAAKSAGALGREGEAAVRAAYNIGDKVKLSINGRVRIPDGLNTAERSLSEVKNVNSLSFTRRLRDYSDYAQSEGFRFDLYTRPDTKLSGPLLNAIDSGFINHLTIP